VPALGELEALVMRKVWDRGQPVTVREIVGDLQPERPVAYTTVMTVMDNLRRKGWLRRPSWSRRRCGRCSPTNVPTCGAATTCC
jgi:predicted transcriptional regulator